MEGATEVPGVCMWGGGRPTSGRTGQGQRQEQRAPVAGRQGSRGEASRSKRRCLNAPARRRRVLQVSAARRKEIQAWDP